MNDIVLYIVAVIVHNVGSTKLQVHFIPEAKVKIVVFQKTTGDAAEPRHCSTGV